MFSIRKAGPEDAVLLHQLGVRVYHSTYSDILSAGQIAFMLDKNYSPAAIRQTMDAGQDFYLLLDEVGQAAGFMALQQKDAETLRIEKLYLLSDYQGLGLGARFITFAADQAKALATRQLELNVNRGNKAYHFYLKQGFVLTEEVDIPYYSYVLDDYIMQKLIL